MDERELEEYLGQAREFLEPLWLAWKAESKPWWQENGEVLSTGMCRFAVSFLKPILDEETGRAWEIKGGMSDFHPDDIGWAKTGKPNSGWQKNDGVGGMISATGVWADHYWLSDGQLIADVTADQFGWDAVILGKVEDERYLANWKRQFVLSHMDNVNVRTKKWRADWAASQEAYARTGPGL